MGPLASLITLNKELPQALYLQIANQLTGLIRTGQLRANDRLPSTRELAGLLAVHRKTVVQAYDELLAQGWLESRTGNGTYAAGHLPQTLPQSFYPAKSPQRTFREAGFEFDAAPHLLHPVIKPSTRLHLDDGFPDARLAPVEELSRAYRSQLLTGNRYVRLGYGDTQGSSWLRQELSTYLNETRGLRIGPENLLIVRGTMMGIYLCCTGLLQPGDLVVSGDFAWSGARMNFEQAGARLATLPADDHGIDTSALERLCKQQTVRMVYITSHHHYPTTVALRADRRMKLLQLAEMYRFIIFEDDYDYDFHCQSKPLLPLAGADQAGMVLYCGSFTKTISPAFRVGYLAGPENVIAHMARLRRIIDRQGDALLENAIAELLADGTIQRHLRRSVRVYRDRRDYFCELLSSLPGQKVQFRKPEGGMAVWTTFDPSVDLVKIAREARRKELYLYDGSGYSGVQNPSTRLGFASSEPSELDEAVSILGSLL